MYRVALLLGLLVVPAQAAEMWSKEDCAFIETLFNNCTYDNTQSAWYRAHPEAKPLPRELRCDAFQPKDCKVEEFDDCGIQRRHMGKGYLHFTDKWADATGQPHRKPGFGVHPDFDVEPMCKKLCANEITVAEAMRKWCTGKEPHEPVKLFPLEKCEGRTCPLCVGPSCSGGEKK